MKLTTGDKIQIAFLIILIIFTIGLIGSAIQELISDNKHNAQIELLEQEILHQEMTARYYEAKLDYYEIKFNEDLDDTDDDFILYMIKEHPDVYIYFMEREETSNMTGELTSLEYTIPKEIRKHYIYKGIQRLLWKELIWLEIN